MIGVILFNIYDINEAMQCYNQQTSEANEAELKRKTMLDAINFFDKAIELNPNDLNAHICKG